MLSTSLLITAIAAAGSVMAQTDATSSATVTSASSSTNAFTSTTVGTTARPTGQTQIPIIGLNPSFTFVGSIVGADQASTTVAVYCQGGATGAYRSLLCQSSVPLTYTYGPSGLFGTSTASTQGVQATASVSCSIGGTTTLSCSESISFSVQGLTQYSTATGSTASSPLPINTVVFTAGVEKLAGASTIPHTGAASSPRSHVMGATTEKGLVAVLLSGAAAAAVLAVML